MEWTVIYTRGDTRDGGGGGDWGVGYNLHLPVGLTMDEHVLGRVIGILMLVHAVGVPMDELVLGRVIGILMHGGVGYNVYVRMYVYSCLYYIYIYRERERERERERRERKRERKKDR
jgi:hypothetical protein